MTLPALPTNPPAGQGDIPNPLAWEDANRTIPPAELQGDGRYIWNANAASFPVYTRVLQPFDGSTVDLTGNTVWTFNGAAAISTAQKRFGSASLHLPGNNADYISTPLTAGSPIDILGPTKGDFTIEGWFYMPTGSAFTGQCFSFGNESSVNVFRLDITPLSGGMTIVDLVTNITSWSGINVSVSPLATGAWHHYAVVRVNNVGYLYVDGVQLGGGADWSAAYTVPAASFLRQGYQAGYSGSSAPLFLDEFRISAVARYTAAFTPPTHPFTLFENFDAALTFIGDPAYMTGIMALTWQLEALSSDGSIPYIAYSTDGGGSYMMVQLPLAQQGLQSGKINVDMTGATGLVVTPFFYGTITPNATFTTLALAITRNEEEGPVWDYPNPFSPINYNCDCVDSAGTVSDTLGNLRARILRRLGFANQAANPPPGMAALVNDFLISSQTYLYRRYTTLRTRRFFRWKIIPGQRFYSLKDNDENVLCNFTMDPNKTIEWAGIQDSRNVWYPLIQGIPAQLYTMLAKPWRPARYDIRQCIEVYPAPDQTYWLWIRGHFGLLAFAADGDQTTLDSELVFLHALANAKAHYGHPDANNIEAQANAYRAELVAGTHLTAHYVPGTIAVPPAVRPTLIQYQDNQGG